MTATQQEVACPKCGGDMWDNRLDKKNPKAPDFKCKNRSCDGVVWPPKNVRPAARSTAPGPLVPEPEWLDDQEAVEAGFVAKTNGAPDPFTKAAAHYDKCFRHAAGLATQAEKAGVVVTLEGVSAIAATLFIATKSAI